MILNHLKERTFQNANDRAAVQYEQLRLLLREIEQRPLPDGVVDSLNTTIAKLNASDLTGTPLKKEVKKTNVAILKLVEKECRLVPRHHYRNLWLALGMSAFGIPLGFAIGSTTGNMGLLSLGLPIGMAVGMAFGSGLDKKALAENRQLNIDIN